ncbi:sigma factor [Sphingopyxis sp. LK2115]|uniref:sigma factor n=1 Tax=Sphingopyxis sp. LK2115 TaxID=2744558 RepID=UPI001660AA6D|nr:sigma factor [Sphingopyxis sp. LK2115]
MELNNRYGGISPRVIRNMKYQAARLARSGALPGIDKEDIEQELMLDLLRRKGRFDPDRASFDTFADRVITNRVASLTASTHKLRAERITISLDFVVANDDEDDGTSLLDKLDDLEKPRQIMPGLRANTTPPVGNNPTACSRAASGPADVCLTNPGPFDETRRPSK